MPVILLYLQYESMQRFTYRHFNDHRISPKCKRKEKYKWTNCISIHRVMRMYEMDEQTIGLNAGKIWDRLKDHTTLTKHQLCVKTGLSDDAFHAAVGWLAREDKIQKNGEFYQLGVTNLNGPIGTNAGI